MRILYGVNSQGQGHFSKAAVLVPLLEARGHEVRVISSGPQPAEGYCFRWHRHFAGLPYLVTSGKTDYGRTFRHWLRQLPEFWQSANAVRRIVQSFRPELILSDFEPLTASPLIGPTCEVVCLSRQVALFDRDIPLPADLPWERKLTRTVIRLFTSGADRLYGFHYEPLSFRCLPPVLRPELFRVRPERGDHILVYCHFDDAEALVKWANSRRQRVLAYGYRSTPRGKQGLVEFREPSRMGMLEDLRTAKAVVTNAGLTTPIEAFLMKKPVCVAPIPGQWEQIVNAFHLQEAGLAEWHREFDFDRVLEVPPPGDHPLRWWLSTHPDAVLDRVLEGRCDVGSTIREPRRIQQAA